MLWIEFFWNSYDWRGLGLLSRQMKQMAAGWWGESQVSLIN
jgi:hypothetical protein